ncbi:MAG: EF-P lysine aminoacylase GenX [Xanthomonadales bacterium]|nr:EF-P lysine aminoacylase GenX [Xanthomonadales bacterium]
MTLNSNLNWKPSAILTNLQHRARLLTATRKFFKQRGVLEVETPILSHSGNPDPNIQSFITAGKNEMYLRTSPEFPLKRLLAAGYGDCYELGKVFRQEESGQFHNPEFTMLEWYRENYSWQEVAAEVVDLIYFLASKVKQQHIRQWPLNWVSYQELFNNVTGLDPFSASPTEFAVLAKKHQLHSPEHLQHDEWLDFIMSMIIQPGLPRDGITIVHDFPASQAALAMLNPKNRETALRFEIYLGQQELANGYQELTNAAELEQRFLGDNQKRKKQNLPAVSLDQHLITAQKQGLPECAGVALGFDRLVMTLTDCQQIANCISFDSSRA